MEVQTFEQVQNKVSGPASSVPSGRLKRTALSEGRSPRISAAGAGALLFDPGTGVFDAEMQSRLLALARRAESDLPSGASVEVVLGVNNLLLSFNPLQLHPDAAATALVCLWENTDAVAVTKRTIELPVVYGGEAGEDLVPLAAGASLSVDEYVRRHSDATYSVACVGSMPGFAYMTGLPAELAVPRRKVPRMKVAEGTVIVGGAQAGVMPCTAPSGWHLVGRTETRMFDARNTPPCLLEPGTEVRFIVKGIEA
ncbi:5-oxoprolinase subunit PxpB [Paraburkholderia fungorum]|uniref:5-oxoprolinase subunit PxpB n=1 Tax=Paraburkholderia fungorum TaxID=134537 RepID=UPI002093C551|nr:5-oxoprolinase subunit PxpB [Paraburkholderia fungorum]USU18879.1 5-oxoprolinase subunit PxpB [Paraburkholderia fungorum]USU29125.1 5-oxoprolinase subunit PxpB [Paraburkholderia fungorum]